MPRNFPSKIYFFESLNVVAFEVLDTFRIHRDENKKSQNHYFISFFILFHFIVGISNNNDRFHLLNTYTGAITLPSIHLIFMQML